MISELVGTIPTRDLEKLLSLFLCYESKDPLISFDTGQTRFCQLPSRQFESCISEMLSWTRREEAEKDPKLKQIIPYIVLLRPDSSKKLGTEMKEKSVFAVTRLEGSTEKRLVGKTSLAVGGHLNHTLDLPLGNPLYAGIRREVSEEVYITSMSTDDPIFRGVIYGGNLPVDQVHFGLLYTLEVKSCGVREWDQLTGSWIQPSSFKEGPVPQLEKWSWAILDHVRYLCLCDQ